VVLLMGEAQGDLTLQSAVVGVLLGVLLLTLICLLAAASLVRWLGVTGINVVTRVFGIVTAALAVQFMIDGARAVWPGV
jgi:multiple antibiotic resistance protein